MQVVWDNYYPLFYYVGQFVVFDCYVESDTVDNTHDDISS